MCRYGPHTIDHATSLSATVILPSKYWVALYGTVDKFLTDSGGEFVNEELITLCEMLNIKVHTTGAESPWSNRIIEGHNLVLSEMRNKVLKENHCSLDISLAWCLIAKNSLQNVHGKSPRFSWQLVKIHHCPEHSQINPQHSQ